MSGWSRQQLTSIGNAPEIDIATTRVDGTRRRSVPIWVVRVGDELFIRSYHGPTGSWFRQVTARPYAEISSGGASFDVALVPDQVTPGDRINDAYAAKYGRGGFVAAMTTPSAAATTLRVEPAP